jgi:TRAP-type mannitol/chloroaromatic compound transport system permease large subunit
VGSVQKKDYGIATSMVSTSRTFGQVIGMALLTIILHAVIGNSPLEEVAAGALVKDVQISFTVFGFICLFGIFISLTRRERMANAEDH